MDSFLDLNVNDIISYFILAVLMIIQTVFGKTQNTKSLLFKNSLNDKVSKKEKTELEDAINELNRRLVFSEERTKELKEKIETLEKERKEFLETFNSMKETTSEEVQKTHKEIGSLKTEVSSALKSTNALIDGKISTQLERKIIKNKKQPSQSL